MNSKLRKSHLIFWMLIVVVLPIIIGISIYNRPTVELNNSKTSSTVNVFQTIVDEIENLKINIRLNKALDKQLEIFIKTPLK
jgi:hypothetical protein